MTNYAFTAKNELPKAETGQVFEMLNFMQAVPNTEIFQGVEGLVFKKCNLVNCKLPEDAKVEDCLHIQKSFCSHVHPKWVEKGLPECSDNCEHLTDTDEITVDGELIDTVSHYEDKLL